MLFKNLGRFHNSSTKRLPNNHLMSKSTVGFSIGTRPLDDANEDVMKQSQLITNLLERNSDNTQNNASSNNTQLHDASSSSPPELYSTSSGISLNSTAASSIGYENSFKMGKFLIFNLIDI